MDDRTNIQNDLYDNDAEQDQNRPLTSFLQAQNAVKVMTEEGEGAEDASFDSAQGREGAEGLSSHGSEAPLRDDPAQEHLTAESSSHGSEVPLWDDLADPSVAIPAICGCGQDCEEGGDDDDYDVDDGGKSELLDEAQGGEGENPEDNHDIDHNKLNTALKALKQIERQVATVIRLLETDDASAAMGALHGVSTVMDVQPPVSGPKGEDLALLKPIDGRVVEGVFDGRGMVGGDGKSYLVPPNYASKSKLVEGDMLKLTITPKGSFIYKQIGPIERSRLIGALGYDQTIGEFYATSDNRRWNVIKASVTYFKGEPGDEVVLLVPKNAPSKWAAVENIIKRNPLG